MNASARRIRLLVGLTVAAFALVALGLFEVMVLDHERWLAHSYANRWSFRDVPAQRGPILDAHGRVVVADQPALCLQVVPAEFLRAHPVGLALHAVTLAAPARRIDLRYGAEAVRAAWSLAWHVPRGADSPARDWRLLWLRLGRSLGAPRAELDLLLQKLRADDRIAVGELLDGTSASRWRNTFELRLEQLSELDRMLLKAGGEGLWDGLQQALGDPARADRLHRPWPRIPHGLGSWLAVHAREFPGLLVGHAVERAPVADLSACPTVPLLLGRVRGLWRGEDASERAQALLLPFLEELAEQEELFGEAVVARARARLGGVAHALAMQSRFGHGGIEGAADRVLAGRSGLRWVDRSSDARELRLWSALAASPGRGVEITIDLELQALAERMLDTAPPDGARERALVLVDLVTGEILALAGRTSEGDRDVASSAASWWAGNGSLGSVVKPFVQLEWLQTRADRDPALSVAMQPCAGRYVRSGSGRRVLRCDHVHGDAGVDPVLALAQSCNSFFFQAGAQIGMEGLQRACARFGLAPGEQDPGSAQRHHRDVDGLTRFAQPVLQPDGQLLETMAIGYGVSASAVSVARAYAALATGSLPELRLWRDGAAHPPLPLAAAEADLLLVREGLRACVRHGTAAARAERPVELARLAEYHVAGKTGTAGITLADGEERNNAWFAGWVPARGSAHGFAFATVAYATRDRMHGAEVAGALIGRLLERIAADPVLAARYLPPEGR